MLRSLDLPLRPALALTTRVSDGTVVLSLAGELVAGRCEALSAWALRRLPACTRLLVVDLAGVTAVDANGLGALVALRRRTEGDVVLTGLPHDVRTAAARSGVLALLPEADQGRALAA